MSRHYGGIYHWMLTFSLHLNYTDGRLRAIATTLSNITSTECELSLVDSAYGKMLILRWNGEADKYIRAFISTLQNTEPQLVLPSHLHLDLLTKLDVKHEADVLATRNQGVSENA